MQPRTASPFDATQQFILTIDQAPAITSSDATTFTTASGGSFHVTVTGTPAPTLSETGALPSGVRFDPVTDLLAGTPAAGTGGVYAITFTAANGVAPDATQQFILTIDQAPAITSANATIFTIGAAGRLAVSTTGFPTPVLSETGALPSGIKFDSATGLLAGTPAAGSGGVYPIIFTAHNGVGANATQPFTLKVDQAPAITSANATSFTVGSSESFQVTTTGFPAVTLSESGTLPKGVTLDSASGVVRGTPVAGTAAVYHLVFTADNGVGSQATQPFTLTVSAAGTSPINPITGPPPGNPSPNDAWLKQVYMDLFHRVVDTSGLTTWTDYLNAGTSRTVVSALIMTSPPDYEYNHDLVESLFHQYLHRDADTGGLAWGVSMLNSGATGEQLALALATSTEYLAANNGTNNAALVTALFRDALGRAVDASALTAFDEYLALGISKAEVVSIVLNSQEYRTDVIEGYYEGFAASPGGPTGPG